MNTDTVETTIIDGDILETTFEAVGTEFDRFTYALICESSGEFIEAVPYVYARNIPRLVLEIIPLTEYPTQQKYAIRNEVLCVKSDMVESIIRLVRTQESTISVVYRQVQDYRQLNAFDGTIRTVISKQLRAFFSSIRVGNTSGEGIFWLPENYAGDTNEDEDIIETDYEDRTRRNICAHIRSRPLPMAHLIPVSLEDSIMLRELITLMPEIDDYAQQTHFVPFLRHDINNSGLKTLMAEEFRCVKNEEVITPEANFIFTEEHMNDTTKPTITEARANLRYYVGDYLDELDLSQSFITGSAISASIIRSNHIHGEYTREVMIDLLYPKVLTQLSPEDLTRLRTDNVDVWNIMAISNTEGKMVKGDDIMTFTIKSGSDVDIAIDNTVSDDEYREIVNKHFTTIKRYCPYVKMVENLKAKGDWTYLIYTDNPDYVPVFRTVELYRSSFRNICTHHVGAVRGCFTSQWSDRPQFYLTASAMWTSFHKSTPNYHYFAGKKSNPQDVIIKNLQRGIRVSDEVLDGLIRNYISDKNIELSKFPLYKGRNVPYSVFSGGLEYPFVREEIQRLAREEARRRQRAADQDRQRFARENERREREERQRIQRENEKRAREERKRVTREVEQALFLGRNDIVLPDGITPQQPIRPLGTPVYDHTVAGDGLRNPGLTLPKNNGPTRDGAKLEGPISDDTNFMGMPLQPNTTLQGTNGTQVRIPQANISTALLQGTNGTQVRIPQANISTVHIPAIPRL